MTQWHGYFVVERNEIGINNWNALVAIFDGMGTSDSKFPAYNLQKRVRLDGNAVLYESQFDSEEVSGQAFRQLLADEFGIPVESIVWSTVEDDYAGYGTTTWLYLYNDILRFTVRRFGQGQEWDISRKECIGYLVLYSDLWDSDIDVQVNMFTKAKESIDKLNITKTKLLMGGLGILQVAFDVYALLEILGII